MARGGPGGIVRSIRPVAALDTAEAATPAASTIPSAPTGSWMLMRIDGHSKPRVDPGSATPMTGLRRQRVRDFPGNLNSRGF